MPSLQQYHKIKQQMVPFVRQEVYTQPPQVRTEVTAAKVRNFQPTYGSVVCNFHYSSQNNSIHFTLLASVTFTFNTTLTHLCTESWFDWITKHGQHLLHEFHSTVFE